MDGVVKECVGSNDESYLVKPAEESKHSSSQPEPTRTRSKRLAQKAMTVIVSSK